MLALLSYYPIEIEYINFDLQPLTYFIAYLLKSNWRFLPFHAPYFMFVFFYKTSLLHINSFIKSSKCC